MDYISLLNKLETLRNDYLVKELGETYFKRKIFAVEKICDKSFSTAIFVAATHGREHITTDLLIKMLEEHLFDECKDFNIKAIVMANPDGVELSCNGLMSAPIFLHENLVKINLNNSDFSMWKANGRGVDINNNFDANFGQNIHSLVPAPSGYVGEAPESELETKLIIKEIKNSNTFFVVTYHSKGEEIYYNFFQEKKLLERDRLIAERFALSTGYSIKNVENYSSGGLKDYCVSKLKIPSLTIEVGSDSLSHPIKKEFLAEIFEKHKSVAKDTNFAYNIFKDFK